jgi:hypothetical protein
VLLIRFDRSGEINRLATPTHDPAYDSDEIRLLFQQERDAEYGVLAQELRELNSALARQRDRAQVTSLLELAESKVKV